jgi:hypothetical protein
MSLQKRTQKRNIEVINIVQTRLPIGCKFTHRAIPADAAGSPPEVRGLQTSGSPYTKTDPGSRAHNSIGPKGKPPQHEMDDVAFRRPTIDAA